ncbi:hypothetical protein BJ170DRAFT_711814 [Xylariales sp. AK1849]|nr:hypothetical protein BJ170DRAFT_711814 [Xylariales sp. AK1849]
MRNVLYWLLALLTAGYRYSDIHTILSPSYPLAVRDPYLSVWIPGNFVANLLTSSPQFWYGNDLGWAIIVRVNGVPYNHFGVSNLPGSVVSGTFLARHSIFVITPGDAQFSVDFFSPVPFTDYIWQSLPFSHLTVYASGVGRATPTVANLLRYRLVLDRPEHKHRVHGYHILRYFLLSSIGDYSAVIDCPSRRPARSAADLARHACPYRCGVLALRQTSADPKPGPPLQAQQ